MADKKKSFLERMLGIKSDEDITDAEREEASKKTEGRGLMHGEKPGLGGMYTREEIDNFMNEEENKKKKQ